MAFPLNEEVFQEWLEHPATRQLREWARGEIKDYQERWANGEFTEINQWQTAMLNAKAVGAVEVLRLIANIELGLIGNNNG